MKTQNTNGINVKHGQPVPVKKVWQSNKMISYMARKYPEITQVCDALEPMQITLTPRDIASATRKHHTKCAFAHAACSTLGAEAAFIGKEMGCIKLGDTLTRFCFPESVSQQLRMYDATGKCEPSTSYRFSAVPTHRRLGRQQRPPKKNGTKQPNRKNVGKELQRHHTENIRKAVPVD